MLNEYATLDQLKLALTIPSADTQDDALLLVGLEAASRSIDDYTQRRFWQDPAATSRRYTPTGRLAVWVDDISTTTGLVVQTDDNDDGVHETTWTLGTDFELEPVNEFLDSEPVPFSLMRALRRGNKRLPYYTQYGLKITARWGWSAVPARIKQATLIQAERLFKRKDSPWGVAGSPEAGNEIRLLARLDPDVEMMIKRYRRVRGFA